MPTEEEQYWEQEYVDFEASHFGKEAFWRAPACVLRGTRLFWVFERFCAKFPDHPHDRNTVFYLSPPSSSPGTYSLLLRCDHFEHSSIDDLRELTEFLAFAARNLTTIDDSHLELLDASAEKLHLRFDSPRDEIITVIQERSQRCRSSCS